MLEPEIKVISLKNNLWDFTYYLFLKVPFFLAVEATDDWNEEGIDLTSMNGEF